MTHKRIPINLDTPRKVMDFIAMINNEGAADDYSLENKDGTQRISAKSPLSVFYASIEFNKQIFLVNDTDDGVFPSGVDQFKI